MIKIGIHNVVDKRDGYLGKSLIDKTPMFLIALLTFFTIMVVVYREYER
jgi:hypothetical protein